jgi:hypothetical protein
MPRPDPAPASAPSPETALAGVLAAIGEATLRADFAALDRLGDALETAIAAVGRDADRAALAAARAEAGRNLALLEAARRGLRDGRSRIAEIARAAAGVPTYAPDGARESLPAAAPATIRRA